MQGSIGKDFKEAFSPSALGSSFRRENAFRIPNQETVELWDDVEYNLGHSSKNASGRGKNSFFDIYNSNADLWDGNSSIHNISDVSWYVFFWPTCFLVCLVYALLTIEAQE